MKRSSTSPLTNGGKKDTDNETKGRNQRASTQDKLEQNRAVSPEEVSQADEHYRKRLEWLGISC